MQIADAIEPLNDQGQEQKASYFLSVSLSTLTVVGLCGLFCVID